MMRHWFGTGCVFLAFMLSFTGLAQAQVKNFIVMISDGWGESQIDATAYWNGSNPVYETEPGWTKIGMSNYMYQLGNENPPYGNPGFIGIHGYDPDSAWADWMYMQNYATDSAAAATAMSCGEKSYNGGIGYNWNHVSLTHMFEHAEAAGLSTGVVTTVPLSHATPAAFRAHNIHRNNYAEIARELFASPLKVVMGGGHPNYGENGQWEPGNPSVPADWRYVGGYDQWNDLVAGVGGWTLIEERADFEALANGTLVVDRVAGIPQVAQTVQYNRAGMPPFNSTEPPYTVPFIANVPTLETMTRGALNVLEQNPLGFALMIEGGAIDWAGHGRTLGRLIEEQNDFDASVAAVVDWVETNSNWNETILVVTGDHETGFLWGPGIDPANSSTWFIPVQDNGPSSMPGFYFYSAPRDNWQNPTNEAGHTNQIIPFYMKGAASAVLVAYADEFDMQWGALGGYDGRYLDNTELGLGLISLVNTTTPVELASFELTSTDGVVSIAWETSFEDRSAGFNILRATEGAAAVQVNDQTIPSHGGNGTARYEFVDRAVARGATYEYTLESIDLNGATERHSLGLVTVATGSPIRQLSLSQNTPNPFNPTTLISFEMAAAGHAKLDIYDAAGHLIRTLVDSALPADRHTVEWNGLEQSGQAVNSGIYFCRLQAGSSTLTRKMTLMK